MTERAERSDIEASAAEAADENGMCEVAALIDNVVDNGHRYNAGDRFHMHKDLIPSHVATGQVKLAAKRAAKGPAKKQTRAPRDKQQLGANDKKDK